MSVFWGVGKRRRIAVISILFFRRLLPSSVFLGGISSFLEVVALDMRNINSPSTLAPNPHVWTSSSFSQFPRPTAIQLLQGVPEKTLL